MSAVQIRAEMRRLRNQWGVPPGGESLGDHHARMALHYRDMQRFVRELAQQTPSIDEDMFWGMLACDLGQLAEIAEDRARGWTEDESSESSAT